MLPQMDLWPIDLAELLLLPLSLAVYPKHFASSLAQFAEEKMVSRKANPVEWGNFHTPKF